MLINEFIYEGQGYVLNGIEELIVRSKARGLTKISTPTLLAKLKASGYLIDMKNLLTLLGKLDSVGSANKQEVTLDTAIPSSPNKKDDQTVSKLASKQIKKAQK
tara:strand:- start:288 stop:599 length:312 start_codon:yes stop_codon:yes gene_type:complete